MNEALAARASVHAALGDSYRLGIAEDLVYSDRSPAELANRFGLPGNLLAHHLAVMEDAGVIRRVISSGDRRRRYVQLRREVLETTHLGGERAYARPVLFVCTHNSARSQLAAAVWTRTTGLPAGSAGTEPAARVHPRAAEIAARAGMDLTACVPKQIDEKMLGETLVVTVCDRAHEELQPASGWWHWSVPDPVEARGRRPFELALDEIDQRVRVACN